MAGRQLRNFLQQAPRGQQSYGPLMPDADPTPEGAVSEAEAGELSWENLARALSPEALQELTVLLNKMGDPDSIARTLPATPIDMTGRDRQEFMQTLPATPGDMTEQERQDFMQQLRGRDPNSVVRESEYRRGRRGR